MIKDDRLTELAYLFMKVNRLHRAYCERIMSDIHMHRGQHMVLMDLVRLTQTASQKELADRLEISPAAVAVMIKKLEKGGFISKKLSKGDNRFNEISITKKGRETVQKTHQYFQRVNETFFSGISKEELETLKSCFQKMADNLDRAIQKEE